MGMWNLRTPRDAQVWVGRAVSAFSALALMVSVIACEEEAPPMQRGGGGGPPGAESAEAKGEPAAPPKSTPENASDAQKAAAAAPGKSTDEAEEKSAVRLPPRVPTTSEMLGMARDENEKQAVDRLPTFLAEQKAATEEQLFQGSEPKPSGAYAEMGQEGMLDVSPLRRHWGGAQHLSDSAMKKRLLANTVVAPKEEDDNALFGPEAALEPADETDAKGREKENTPERKFTLTMYRLNKQTLKVETVTRSYATEPAKEAARRFLQKEGYSEKQPSPKTLQALRDEQEKRAHASQKKAQEACPFRATWTDNGVTNSRCFPSADALAAFQKARQSAAKTPQKQAPPVKAKASNSNLRQNPIQPVKLN